MRSRERFWNFEREEISVFEGQSRNAEIQTGGPAVDETDSVYEKMIEFEPLHEVPEGKIIRSVILTHGNFSCQCKAQFFCDPEKSHLVI